MTEKRVRPDLFTVLGHESGALLAKEAGPGLLQVCAVYLDEGWHGPEEDEVYLRRDGTGVLGVLAHRSGNGYRYGHHVSGMRGIETHELFGYWAETKKRCEQMMRFLGILTSP